MQEKEKNAYGMALSSYTLGYIYENFAEELCKESSKFTGLCLEEHERYLVKNETESFKKAIREFQIAFDYFR